MSQRGIKAAEDCQSLLRQVSSGRLLAIASTPPGLEDTSEESIRRDKPTWAMMAPSFPLAAQIPCAVDLYRVGKTSPGMMNVVVLGPKFWKKLAIQYCVLALIMITEVVTY